MDNLDFLDEAPASQEPAPVETQDGPPETQPRDESGRFAPKQETEPQPEPVVVAQPEPTPVEPKQPETQQVPPGYVPIAALQAEREKNRALQQAPQPIPDPYDDPEGYAAHQSQVVEQALLNTRLNISEEMARDKHGNELVDAAREWLVSQNSPALGQDVLSHRNPYGRTVELYQQHQLLNEFNDPAQIEAFRAWRAAQAQAQQQQPAAQPATPQPPATPPPSLASAPSAGGPQAIPMGQEATFDAAFK